MQGFKAANNIRSFSGFSPLHESISEEHVLQTFDYVHNHDTIHLIPASPRPRSLSLYESGRTKTQLFPKLYPHTTDSDSTDSISNFDSLPQPYRRSNRHLGKLNTQLLEAIKSCKPLEVQSDHRLTNIPNTRSNEDALPSFEIDSEIYQKATGLHVGSAGQKVPLKLHSCGLPDVDIVIMDGTIKKEKTEATTLAYRLINAGANPNTTCHTEFISACHIAVLHNNDILSILLKHGAERNRADRLGRTPLHLAAWSGNVKHVIALLNFPEELQNKIDNGELITEIEEEIKSTKSRFKDIVDVKCVLGDLNVMIPKLWRDDADHSCKDIDLPFLQPGWTPLHAAASAARHLCVRVLLAAGADSSIRDFLGRIPLDVAGSSCILSHLNKQLLTKGRLLGPTLINFGFTEVIKMLLAQSRNRGSFTRNHMLDTPLHTAVELDNLDAIKLLLQAGVPPASLNRAGLTPIHLCVKKKLKQHLQAFIYVNSNNDVRSPGLVNVKDKDGYTVLHYAVLNNWQVGVCIALEAQANMIIAENNGETPIHTAAALGNSDILKDIISYAKNIKMIDVRNRKGETPLFKAIINGHIDCVKLLLKKGASIEDTLPRQYNVFHVAANLGHHDILKVLLDHNYTFTREKINFLTTDDRKCCGPIHFAVENNHVECVKLLLSKNAFVSLKIGQCGAHRDGSTPLHIAARKNDVEIAKVIVKFDPSTIHNVDVFGWTPLHTASFFASRDVIKLLILKGSNLAARTAAPQKYEKTAIELIMTNLSKPTEFMETIFDLHIDTFNHKNKDLDNPDTAVRIDFSILIPNNLPQQKLVTQLVTESDNKCTKERTSDVKLTVIEAILKTGNRRGQKRLLIHPLVESYLCLKWKALLPFFYFMIFLYGLFVVTLTIFIISEYFYKDNKTAKPRGFNTSVWTYVLYATITLILLQEIINVSMSFKRYLLRLETWVKFLSMALAMSLPKVIELYPFPPPDSIDWPRHIATVAILLGWMNMTFLLSRFPSWGYYLLMFGKVSINVLKILLTFTFILVGFSLSFMVQFHHQSPFETIGSALVKTMVMMTSEFDYDDLVDSKEKSSNILQSLVVIRLLFLAFLILASIVLMNLMVGVAVNDLNNLEVLGNIMRLEKQVEFLASLETLVLKKVFLKILPAKWKYNLELSSELKKIILKPCEPAWSYYKAIPAHVREAIFAKALAQRKNEDHQVSYETLRKQLVEIHESIKKSDEYSKKVEDTDQPISLRQIPRRLTDTDLMVVRMKKQVDELSAKIDMMMQLMINQTLRE